MEGREGNRGGEDEGIDYISSLPLPLFLHILSFLSLEDSLRAISFRKFLPLWTSLDALIFSRCNFHACHDQRANPEFELEFMNFVNRVLSNHDRPEISKFSLSMHIPFPPRDRTYNRGTNQAMEPPGDVWPYPVAYRHDAMWKRVLNTVDSWIRFSLLKKVKILDLDFMACGSPARNGSDCYVLPGDVLKSTHLVELRLVNCRFDLLQGIHPVSLSRLSLVHIILSEEIISLIMTGCVALKELSLLDCTGLKKLRIIGHFPLETLSVSSHCLEDLSVTLYQLKLLRVRVFMLRELYFFCPRFSSLDLYGPLNNVRLNCFFSPGDATLCLGLHFRPCTATYGPIRALLKTLSRRQIVLFNSCPWFILIFSIWELTKQRGMYFTWRSVTAPLVLTKWVIPGICRLLKDSYFLEDLVLYMYPFTCHPRLTFPVPQWLEAHDFNVSKYLDSVRVPFPQLKKVKLCGNVMEPYVMKLIEFLLGIATTLEEMVIALQETPPRHNDECAFVYEDGELPIMTPDMVAECSRKVFGFPRASERATIHFI